jgi:hypothetical protein|tara:strand:+ start:449 stop:673 length:225 start_codon:yes stop_codon:yes gene_type:complete
MKKILTQYLWIFVTIFLLLNLTITITPKKNSLDKMFNMIEDVEQKKKILTQTERELEKLATERDWEQVDKDTTK